MVPVTSKTQKKSITSNTTNERDTSKWKYLVRGTLGKINKYNHKNSFFFSFLHASHVVHYLCSSLSGTIFFCFPKSSETLRWQAYQRDKTYTQKLKLVNSSNQVYISSSRKKKLWRRNEQSTKRRKQVGKNERYKALLLLFKNNRIT